jgi:hypothetical protein
MEYSRDTNQYGYRKKTHLNFGLGIPVSPGKALKMENAFRAAHSFSGPGANRPRIMVAGRGRDALSGKATIRLRYERPPRYYAYARFRGSPFRHGCMVMILMAATPGPKFRYKF